MDPKEKERRERSRDEEEKNDVMKETHRPERTTNNDSTAWLRASARPVPPSGRAEAECEPG